MVTAARIAAGLAGTVGLVYAISALVDMIK